MKSAKIALPSFDFAYRVLAGLTLCVVAGWPVVQNPRGRIIGLVGDAHIFSWGLQYATFWPIHGTHPLFTKQFFPFSGGANLAANTFVPGIGLATAPITSIFGVQVAYNFAMLGSLGLNFLFISHVASRIFHLRTHQSIVVGLIFCLSAAQTSSLLGHLHLALLAPAFALVLRGFQLFDGKVSSTALISASWLGMVQALTSSEILLVTVVVVTSVSFIESPSQFWPKVQIVWKAIAALLYWQKVLFLVPVVVLSYFGFFALKGPQAYAGAHQPPNIFVTDLASLVVPPDSSYLKVSTSEGLAQLSLPFSGNQSEWYAFIGISTLGFLIWNAKTLWASKPGKRCLLLVIVGMTLSFGPSLHVWGKDLGIPLPWGVVQHLPVFSSVIPARFAIFGMLGVAGCFAFLFQQQVRGAGIATAMVLLSVAPTIPLRSSPMPDQLYRTTAQDISVACPASKGSVGIVGAESPYLGLGLQARSRNGFLLENGFAFRSEGPEGVLDLNAALVSPSGPRSRCIFSLDGPLSLDQKVWTEQKIQLGYIYSRESDSK
jgi:hypothetical protein